MAAVSSEQELLLTDLNKFHWTKNRDKTDTITTKLKLEVKSLSKTKTVIKAIAKSATMENLLIR